ncbi:MAG TPA: glutathione S-transferase [Allosphingosinicella sp.]|uniref:glutathione S-transferase family protein n=1 Tax=Allosphingosinicella sp. TaxID=2823234 RepID=UPI002EDA8845
MADWQLYGARGWGSTLAEGALAWTGTAYEFVDVKGFDKPGAARDRLIAVNPLARVPTLLTPEGLVLTESAAVILHLAERCPDSWLAPQAGDPQRPLFLNRLIWLVSALYPTFTYADYPERWAPDAPKQLVQNVAAFRKTLWLQFEAEIGEGPFVMGDTPSALDLYVTVMSHWRPTRSWLEEHCPKLHAIALGAEKLSALAPVMARNFQ